MKHDWNSLENYLNVHSKTLRDYAKRMEDGVIRQCSPTWWTPIYLELSCQKIFFITDKGNRVRVDIRKEAEIDDTYARPRARTIYYEYSCNEPGKDTLIRYCGPDPDYDPKKHPPHHDRHHRHDFTSGKEIITPIESDAWPHVSDFFDEVLKSF